MQEYTMKPMTESSWILQRNGNRIALVTTKDGKLLSIGGKLEKNRFEDIKDLEKFLGSKIEIEQTEEESTAELGNVGGYPVKHAGAIPVEGAELPVYKRTKNSNTEYSAGYYGIKFNHGWTASYCPKLTTLTENEFVGPFTTKLEMQNSMSQKKRAIDI